MKRLLLLLSILFVTLMSSTAFADHLYLIPNDGSGGNFGFVGYMNGHPLFLDGGTPASFFGADVGYAPGSIFGGSDTLYLYSTTIWIDGVPLEFGFNQNDSTIFISSVAMPTNGRDFFTAFVQVDFFAIGINFDTGQTVQVGGGAFGKIPFYYAPFTGLYYPGDFMQTPEPGMLGLVGTGIIGILALTRNRLKRARM